MFAQLLRCLWLTVLLEVGGRCDGYPVGGTDVTSDQATVIQWPDPERHVQAFADQVLVLIIQLQVDFNLWISLEECRQARSNLQAPEADRRADAQMTGNRFSAGLETVLGCIDGGEDLSALAVVALAFIGQG